QSTPRKPVPPGRRPVAPGPECSYGGTHHQGKQGFRVRPPGLDSESGCQEQLGYAGPVVFAADLGPDGFAPGKGDLPDAGDPDLEVVGRHQMHFDPVSSSLVEGPVLERPG